MCKMIQTGMLAVLVCAALASGCASTKVQPDKYSGYLGNGYSLLQERSDPLGEVVLAYVNPRFVPSNYSAVIIDPIQYYPRPQPTEQVSETTLIAIREYANQRVRLKFEQKFQVVDRPGPGVARVSIAFTGVRGVDKSLAFYQYVPQAFVATQLYRAVEGTPQQARLLCEILIVDSVSEERLAMQIRQGSGEALKKVASGKQVVTLDDVKPLIDNWVEASADALTRLVKPR
jgi:hypothetical protein